MTPAGRRLFEASPRLRALRSYFLREDTAEVAHRSLLRDLVPAWVREGRPFSADLSSHAYGDTPAEVVWDLMEAVQARPHEVFLDLGCGCGLAVLAASRRVGRAVGVERLPGCVRFARQAARRLGMDNVEIRLGDLREADPREADVVYLAATAWGPDLRAACAHLLRRCRPGTRVMSAGHALEGPHLQPLPRREYRFRWSETSGESQVFHLAVRVPES